MHIVLFAQYKDRLPKPVLLTFDHNLQADTSVSVLMGGTQSKDPVVLPVRNESSIKFSPALLSQLSNNLDSPNPSPEREEALDKHVRQRIQAELAKLQAEEEVVKSALRDALEKENLGRERSLTGEPKASKDSEGNNAGSRGTASLREDIEAVKRRVERYSERRQLGAGSDSSVEASRQAVVKCYRENADRPLDCWKQVEEFKQQVANIEAKFVESLK